MLRADSILFCVVSDVPGNQTMPENNPSPARNNALHLSFINRWMRNRFPNGGAAELLDRRLM
jgi:hypothetical protein